MAEPREKRGVDAVGDGRLADLGRERDPRRGRVETRQDIGAGMAT